MVHYYFRRYLAAGLAGVTAFLIGTYILGMPLSHALIASAIGGVLSGIVRDHIEKGRADR